MLLEEIIEPISNELRLLEQYTEKLLYSDTQFVNEILKHVYLRPGKRLRSSIMLLIGRLFGDISDKLIKYAAMTEILHNATIIHDDIVDEATARRGLISVNAKWSNKTAVLLGDYLFAKAFEAIHQYNDFDLLNIFAKTTAKMSEGELLAIDLSNSATYSESHYYEIIYCKTASLIEAACKISAMIYTNTPGTIANIANYGRNIGLGFQIKDDMFDYTSEIEAIGKPVGNDIKEKQITLPLIHALNNSDNKTKEQIIDLIRQPLIADADITKITDFAKSKGGIEYAQNKAEQYAETAVKCLDNFPQSDIKNRLIHFAQYMISRKH